MHNVVHTMNGCFLERNMGWQLAHSNLYRLRNYTITTGSGVGASTDERNTQLIEIALKGTPRYERRPTVEKNNESADDLGKCATEDMRSDKESYHVTYFVKVDK